MRRRVLLLGTIVSWFSLHGGLAHPPARPAIIGTVVVGRGPRALSLDVPLGRVYVANNDSNTVSMLSAATGTVLHTTQVGIAPVAVLASAHTTHVFVGTAGDLATRATIGILDAATARVLRTVRFTNYPQLAADEHTAHLFAASLLDPVVGTFDAWTGAPVRTLTIGPLGSTCLGLAVAPRLGQVYVTTGERLNVLATTTGRLLRTATVGPFPGPIVVDEPANRLFIANLDANASTSPNNQIRILDARTLAAVRTIRTGTAPLAFAIDQRIHHVFVMLASPVRSPETPSGPGRVGILDARSGVLLRTIPVGRFIDATSQGIAVDEPLGLVFVVNMLDNSVSVLDARTGTVRHTLRIGRDPLAVVLDEQRQRAFIANSRSGTVTVVDSAALR